MTIFEKIAFVLLLLAVLPGTIFGWICLIMDFRGMAITFQSRGEDV